MNKIFCLFFVYILCLFIHNASGVNLFATNDICLDFGLEQPTEIYYNPFITNAKGNITIKPALIDPNKIVLLKFRLYDAVKNESKSWHIELEKKQTSVPIYLFVYSNELKNSFKEECIRLDIARIKTNDLFSNQNIKVLSSITYKNIIWKFPDQIFSRFRLFVTSKRTFLIDTEFPIFRLAVSDEFIQKDWITYSTKNDSNNNKSKIDYIIYLEVKIKDET